MESRFSITTFLLVVAGSGLVAGALIQAIKPFLSRFKTPGHAGDSSTWQLGLRLGAIFIGGTSGALLGPALGLPAIWGGAGGVGGGAMASTIFAGVKRIIANQLTRAASLGALDTKPADPEDNQP